MLDFFQRVDQQTISESVGNFYEKEIMTWSDKGIFCYFLTVCAIGSSISIVAFADHYFCLVPAEVQSP